MQVHGVPEAVVLEQTEEGGGHDHGNAAGDAALDAGGELEGFDGQDFALGVAEGQALDAGAGAGDLCGFFGDGDDFSGLDGEHVAEPADGGGQREQQAEQTDDAAGDHARDDERDAEASTMGQAVGSGMWTPAWPFWFS